MALTYNGNYISLDTIGYQIKKKPSDTYGLSLFELLANGVL